jgi:hypothetical protein
MFDRAGQGTPLKAQLELPLGLPAEPPPLFVRHRRARRYILRVLRDGTLRVTLPRWGSKREAEAFVRQSAPWIAKQRAARLHAAPAQTRPRADERALRAQAKRDLPAALQALASAHGVTVSSVSIRNQRARWGSCSRDGRITLNWRLVLVPDFVREYVMVHELMHTRQLNHSAKFWRLVAEVCPRFMEARAWLRAEGDRLF